MAGFTKATQREIVLAFFYIVLLSVVYGYLYRAAITVPSKFLESFKADGAWIS